MMSGDIFAVHAACIRGVEAQHVTVEVSLSGSIPGINIVGASDSVLTDGRARIRSALRERGYEVPRKAITVNLSPGDIRKTGSGFDLPIAVAILAASGQIKRDGLDCCLFVGELALTGSVLPVKGEVAYQLLARDMGLSLVSGYTPQHVSMDGVASSYLEHIGEIRGGIDEGVHEFARPPKHEKVLVPMLDYADVSGQEMAKRGLAIAAAGNLGLLMVGAPGSGKSMLAQRMTTILPPLKLEDQQEALRVHSVAGEDIENLLAGRRPFRAPHHSVSMAGLIGGGRPVGPGEISLAHGGVLFLDELAEFPNGVLQSLRQPIEQGFVRIVRADGCYQFPSRFQLLAASNPCPCGYLGDREVACKCSDMVVERYRAKLRGPLADRIDIMLDVARPDPDQMVKGSEGASSAQLTDLVVKGREFARWRLRKHSKTAVDPHKVALGNLVPGLSIDTDGEKTMLAISRRNHLTGRSMVRLGRIARTIADIAQSETVGRDHLLEASMLQGRRDE